MLKPLPLLGQIVAYALFAATIAYFSTAPAYTYLDPGAAVIKVGFTHAARHQGDCRRLTPDEIAKLPPAQRRPLDCVRERYDVRVELLLDGQVLYAARRPPTGLAHDGMASVYQRFVVAPGAHVLTARLADSGRAQGYDYEHTARIELAPGRNFVVDFQADRGGFILK